MTVSFGQNQKEELFARTVKNVIAYLSKRDSVRLSNYIDKKTGVYILYSIGTKWTYKNFKTIGFSDSTYPNNPFYDKVKFTTIKYAPLPAFDCRTEKWTKKGLYVDTLKLNHLLSKTARSCNKYFTDKIPTKTILKFSELETKSRRLIVTADDWGNELIFYLSYHNNKWVLTIIDKVTCDCSV